MDGDWEKTNLEESLSFKNGKGLKTTFYDEHGIYPVWGANGQIARTNYCFNEQPVIVIGRVGANCGSVHVVFEHSWVTDNAIVATPKKHHDIRYLYYLLKHIKPDRASIGSAQPLVTQSGLKFLEYFRPSLPEQHAIAHILGSLDDKIELNKQTNESLEEMARTIFKSWFVDFDPVRAKAEGRDTGLPDEIADLFPDSFEESELGRIPKGWAIEKIGKAVRCVGGSTPSTKEPSFWEGGAIPFVTPKDMSLLDSSFIMETSRYITEEGVAKISSRRLPAGTVLLSSRAPIGYLAITDMPVSVNQGIIGMICDQKVPNLYVLYWAKEKMGTIKNNACGTTFAEISKKNFRPIKLVVPNNDLLKIYMQHIKPYFERLSVNQYENKHLASIRDTLLPKLISGELRVPEAEKIAEECA